MAGVDAPVFLTITDSFEVAKTICDWLLDDSNDSKGFAVAKYEDVKANVMRFLDLQDPKLFALRFEFLPEPI